MQKVLRFRNGAKEDSSDLALLLDVAGRGLPAYLWSIEAKQGQSAYEYGREKIRSDENRRSYYKNWYVAENNGILVGAFFGFIVEIPYPEIDYNDITKYLHPIVELEKVASGSWLLQAISILPEYRGYGFAIQLLRKVEKVVKALGLKSISLQVEEVNNIALEIYKKNGFVEIDRRSYIPFPGSHDTGDFILMMKNLK